MRRALLLIPLLLVAACGSDSKSQAVPTLPSLPPISLAPVGPADLSAPPSVARLLGAYDGDACAPATPVQVRDLVGVLGRVEFAVKAGTTIPPDPPATSTSCLYAAIASSIGISLPGPAAPPEVATYAGQLRDALSDCRDRTTRGLTVLGLPGTLISCPSEHSRVLALRGKAFSAKVVSSPTCAVLNAEQVDENRFLSFCAGAFRRAAAPAGTLPTVNGDPSATVTPTGTPSATATP